jgi:hypothetical protein
MPGGFIPVGVQITFTATDSSFDTALTPPKCELAVA